jgi:hypothetical protein
MLVGALVLLLGPVLFVAGTSLGRAFGRNQAFEEAAALLRFDATRAALRGEGDDARLLRMEARRVQSANDGVPADGGEPAREPVLEPLRAGDASA